MKMIAFTITLLIISDYLGPCCAAGATVCSRAFMVIRKSFGCPFGSNECSKYCKEKKAQKGGYCTGRFKENCVCFRN
ncbi:defensin-like isoform X1 [Dermacentor variabilis]|uniref:defensin-like isoform X1 n=1 Tax=Dermacentor variabilis TaxID=34621 RepID=UPI003F5BD65B